MENKRLLPISIIILAVSILLGSAWIGYGLVNPGSLQNSILASTDNQVFNLSQAAKYLNMTEDEVDGIIESEKNTLNKTGTFHGKMFPYFVVNTKPYFYKSEIDEWLKDVSMQRREYNTKRQSVN